MTGSVYYSCSSANKQMQFRAHCIKRALQLDMQTSLDFTQQQTYSEARYTHCVVPENIHTPPMEGIGRNIIIIVVRRRENYHLN